MPKFIIQIGHQDQDLIDNDDICCYLADENSDSKILELAKASDKLVLAVGENCGAFCLALNLDGVMTTQTPDENYPKYIKALQKQIGKKFFGARVAPTRHEAMIAGEAEPDFIAFALEGADLAEAQATISWYSELFLIQSAVIWRDDIDDFSQFNTDFLILNSVEYKILVDKIKRLD